jgi:transcriptional antiterminator RfaH
MNTESTTVSEEQSWYVVRSKSRREEYAQDQLIRRGVETFLPRVIEHVRGVHPVVGPLFPGYLFARIHLESQYTSVIWAPGVHNMVAFGDTPTPVDREVIEFLFQRCGAEGVVRRLPAFADGDRVRVVGGPLEGLHGIVQGRASGRERVRVLMQLLGRQTHVSLSTAVLERMAS